MQMHNFKYVPRPKLKVHIISGWDPSEKVFKYHCKNCDSTVEFEKKVSEAEINRFFTDPAKHFPCLKVNKL